MRVIVYESKAYEEHNNPKHERLNKIQASEDVLQLVLQSREFTMSEM